MKFENRGRSDFGGPREEHEIECAECHQKAKVPFKPRPDRPVYCKDCYQKHRK